MASTPLIICALMSMEANIWVDVTSVRGIGKAPAKLSARERQIAEQAKKEGFKILVPTVRFLENWQVMVELVEE